MKTKNVRIAGVGSFLPGPPIPNDRLETVLGSLDQAPPKVRGFVSTIGPRMLERSGVRTRHFAIDPETHDLTHTNASLAEAAARRALDMAGVTPQEVDLVVLGCASYDHSTPPTSSLLQERLNIPFCAEMEIHSNCSGVGKGVQVAFDALRTGRYRTALVCYSQLSSVYLRSCYFHQPAMDKVHAALRWILADGAAALVLQGVDDPNPRGQVLETYVESVGAGRTPGMTCGGATADLVKASDQIPDLYRAGRHHLWQDFTAVSEQAGVLLLEGLLRFTDRAAIPSASVDHYIVSIPTLQLYERHLPQFMEKLGIEGSRLQFRSAQVGYTGGAATLIHLDQMVRSGELSPGQLAIVHAVESSKWMTAGFAVRW